MTRFRIDRQHYIVVVRREDVETTRDDPVRLAIYAPGTVCHHWSDHAQKPDRFNYGFLAWVSYLYQPSCWGLVGSECLKHHYDEANPQPWKTVLDRHHPLAGTGLDDNWRAQTKRDYWRLAPLMGMILQVEPTRNILRGYLERATHDSRPFTRREKETLLAILRERGGKERAAGNGRETWNRELKSHRKTLKRRRDLAFRLARLAALDLDPEDRATVKSLQAYNTKWLNRGTPRQRMLVLTKR